MKNILKIAFLLIGIFCLSFCERAETSVRESFKDVEEEKLTGVPLILNHLEDNPFSYMFEMTYIDSLLVIHDVSSDHNLKIVNLKNASVINFALKGRGPNEMKSSMSVFSIDKENNQLYVSDFFKYFIYNIDSLKLTKLDPIQSFEFKPKGDNFLSSTYVPGNYIVGGHYNSRFGFYNITSKENLQKFTYQNGGPMVNQAVYYSHPRESKVAFFLRRSGQMGFLEISDNDIILKEKIWWMSKDTEVNDGETRTVKPHKDSRIGFITASATENYVYSLYSGKQPDKTDYSSIMNSFLSDEIFVFDWEGNPIKKIKLDQKVRSIAVDEENKIIYGASYENNLPHLVSFKMQ